MIGKWVIGVVKRLDRHFAGNRRELPQEFVQGVAAFQVVDEVLERNSRASEARGSAHDLRVGHNHRFNHSRLHITVRQGDLAAWLSRSDSIDSVPELVRPGGTIYISFINNSTE